MKKVLCTCGCGKYYVPSTQEPVGFLVSLRNGDGDILEIEREDGIKFRVGDTIHRISETGKKYRRFVLASIRTIPNRANSIHMWGYTVDSHGGVDIRNEMTHYGNAEDPNLLRFIYK